MADFLIILIVASIVSAAILYIRKEKKSGAKCIGCPASGACGKQKQDGCKCDSQEK